MDARIDPAALLGLTPGDAHVIRDAGGVVTDDAVRSLAISQHLLGTRQVMIVMHTGCGMLSEAAGTFRRSLEAQTGVRPSWAVESFSDLDDEVRQSMARLRASPFIARPQARGFVYDVQSGRLREVA